MDLMRTPRWLLAAALVTGCGDDNLGIPRSAQVPALEDADALEICGEFVAQFCADATQAEFCNPCVTDELCAMPSVIATMDTECAGVTVGQVRDCAEGGTVGICAQGGGCMIDVGEALCH